MDDIVKNLQTIQEDLVGIVLPVVVTSCVSFVIVLINTMKEIFLQRAGFKFEQFKLMQEFYPQFKGYLLELKIIAEEIEDIPIVSDLQHAINKYIEIRKNERQYRTVHDDEIPYIDNFIKKMKCFSKKFTELNDYFCDVRYRKI